MGPGLEKLVLGHPAFVKKVGHGPLARMPPEARAVRLTSKLLLDAVESERLHRRGYFGWDDGTAQLALSIGYAWRHAADPRAWMTQKPKRLRLEAQGTIRRIFREHRSEPLARVLELRYFQTFYSLTDLGPPPTRGTSVASSPTRPSAGGRRCSPATPCSTSAGGPNSRRSSGRRSPTS